MTKQNMINAKVFFFITTPLFCFPMQAMHAHTHGEAATDHLPATESSKEYGYDNKAQQNDSPDNNKMKVLSTKCNSFLMMNHDEEDSVEVIFDEHFENSSFPGWTLHINVDIIVEERKQLSPHDSTGTSVVVAKRDLRQGHMRSRETRDRSIVAPSMNN